MSEILSVISNNYCWKDESSLDNYALFRKDNLSFNNEKKNGEFLFKDNNLVGYRNKSFSNASWPSSSTVIREGNTYKMRQSIYCQFIPEEIKPYLDQLKNNENIIAEMANSVEHIEQINSAHTTNFCIGLDIDPKTGIVFGFPYKSGNVKLVIRDFTNAEFESTATTMKWKIQPTIVARISFKVTVDNPIRESEVGTQYIALRVMSIEPDFTIGKSGFALPPGLLDVHAPIPEHANYKGARLNDLSICFGENNIPRCRSWVSSINLEDINVLGGFSTYKYLNKWIPKGSKIKIVTGINKFRYDLTYQRVINEHAHESSKIRLTRFGIYTIYEVDNLATMNGLPASSGNLLYRNRIIPGTSDEKIIELNHHTAIFLSTEYSASLYLNFGWKDMEDPYWAGYKIVQ